MDLLVSALFKDSRKPARVLFLMEHKSQEDPDLLRQFLIYQAGIYQSTRDPVLPIFINQSPNKTWKGVLDFHGFLDNFEGELKKRFKENVLNFRPRVLNIQALDIDKAKGLTTRPILYILKHIWNLNDKKIKGLFTIGRGLSQSEREALIVRAVDYVRQYDPNFNWKIIREIEQTTVKKEERVMAPLLQYSLDEAREEGLKKGLQKGIYIPHKFLFGNYGLILRTLLCYKAGYDYNIFNLTFITNKAILFYLFQKTAKLIERP